MSLFGREDLLAFKDLVTYFCGAIDLMLPIGEGKHQRKVTLSFHMIQYRSAFKGIMGRSILEILDVVTYLQ